MLNKSSHLILIFFVIFLFFSSGFLHHTKASSPLDVVITEVMWMGSTRSTADEWLELQNQTDQPINLENWQIDNAASPDPLVFPKNFIIPAHSYFLIANYDDTDSILNVHPDWITTKISLSNSSGKGWLILKDAAGTVIDQTSGTTWPAGNNTNKASLERKEPVSDGSLSTSWQTAIDSENLDTEVTDKGTPHNGTNLSPVAKIVIPTQANVSESLEFDGSESFDYNSGKIVNYAWNFGDQEASSSVEPYIKHTYTKAGTFNALLTVIDDQGSQSTASAAISIIAETVESPETPSSENQTNNPPATQPANTCSTGVALSEFLPAPGKVTDWDNDGTASSADEWIELYNSTDKRIDLSGWFLDDVKDAGSAPYQIPHNTFINPKSFLVFYHRNTGLTLNNDQDSVRLLCPDQKIIDTFSYNSTHSDLSFAKDSQNKWLETIKPTPGLLNSIVQSQLSETAQNNTSSNTEYPILTIKEIRTAVLGKKVTITGIITATPDALGVRVLYLQDSTGGLKVKLNDEDYSTLTLGDQITVSGVISEAYNERYLNMQSDNTVKIISHKDPQKSSKIRTGEVNESSEGKLIFINGRVTSTSGNTFFLNDGSGDIKVYIKDSTEIDKPKMRTGYYSLVQGIVSQYKDEYRILPRSQEDVIVSTQPISDGEVLGISSLPDTGSSNYWSGLILIVVGLIIKVYLKRN